MGWLVDRTASEFQPETSSLRECTSGQAPTDLPGVLGNGGASS